VVADVIAVARELVRKSGGTALLPRLREAEARLQGRTIARPLPRGCATPRPCTAPWAPRIPPRGWQQR
jgi:hypothetical protein